MSKKLTKTKLKSLFDSGLTHNQISVELNKEKIVSQRGAKFSQATIAYYCKSWGLTRRKKSKAKIKAAPVKKAGHLPIFETVTRLLGVESWTPAQRADLAIKILKTEVK